MSRVVWSTVLAITAVGIFIVAGNAFAPNAYADYYDADQGVQSPYGSYDHSDNQLGRIYPQYKPGQGFPPSPHHTPFYEPSRGSASGNYWPSPSENQLDPYASGYAHPASAYYPPPATTTPATTTTTTALPTTSASTTATITTFLPTFGSTTTTLPTTSAGPTTTTTTLPTTSASSTTTVPTTSASTTIPPTTLTSTTTTTTTLPTTSASTTTILPTTSASTTTTTSTLPTTTASTTTLQTTSASTTTTLPTTSTSTTITTTTLPTTTASTTTTRPICVNGVGSSCLAFDRADTANIREGTEAPISTSACTTTPISKSCYNSHTEAESMDVKSGPVPSRVKVTTGTAFCDPAQTCVCVENGECFTVFADNNCVEVGLDFYPYCECLPGGGTECHTYLSLTEDQLIDPSCAGFSMVGDMGTNHDGSSEFTNPGEGPPLGRNSVYLKAVSVSCSGCASIKGNTCPN